VLYTQTPLLPRDATRFCYGMFSVCPSVCPSVTLVDFDHIGWNSSKVISHLVCLGCSLSVDLNIMDLLQGHSTEILAGIGMDMEKCHSVPRSSSISETRQDRTKFTIFRPTGSHLRAFDWCQNQRPWMTLKGYYALCFEIIHHYFLLIYCIYSVQKINNSYIVKQVVTNDSKML